MGRYSYGGRDTVESACKIELSWLKNNGFFPKGGGSKYGSIQWSRNGERTGNIGIYVDTSAALPYMRFTYRSKDRDASDEEWVDRNYQFPLEKVPCRYGGYKWFVRCQLSKGGVFCGRRVRILYLVGGYYGCRHCADLTYESCNEANRYRGGIFRILSRSWKADEYLETLKRYSYRGRPTRKYRKYLRLQGGYSSEQIEHSMAQLSRILGK